MPKIVRIDIPFRLLGTWRPEYESDDGFSEYAIALESGRVRITGRHFGSGEQYIISDVHYDAESVSFNILEPSASRTGRLEFKATDSRDSVTVNCSFTHIQELVRSAVPDAE